MNKIMTVLMWIGIVILIPVVISFFVVLLLVDLLILLAGMIFLIIAHISGNPINVTRNGKTVGVLIRGKFFPRKSG